VDTPAVAGSDGAQPKVRDLNELQLHRTLARVLTRLGLTEMAAGQFRRAFALQARLPQIGRGSARFYLSASSHSLKVGRDVLAVHYLEKAIEVARERQTRRLRSALERAEIRCNERAHQPRSSP
jgi:uncharacterized protein HemY